MLYNPTTQQLEENLFFFFSSIGRKGNTVYKSLRDGVVNVPLCIIGLAIDLNSKSVTTVTRE